MNSIKSTYIITNDINQFLFKNDDRNLKLSQRSIHIP